MRLRALVIPALLVPALIALSACGTTQSNESQASADPTSASDIASEGTDDSDGEASDTEVVEEEPADTEVAPPVPRDQMPQVSGEFGDKPTITMPENDPPDSLQRVILSEGDGPVSEAGDTVVVNYLGQIWGGDVFDNSYDRGSPFTTQVGGAQRTVVVGWDIGLQGVAAGSRVLLTFPPRDGYGSQGSPPNIGGTDTLVFVVDVLSVYGIDTAGQTDAILQEIPQGWPTISGELGGLPSVDIPADLPDPAEAGATVIAEGTGEPAQAGQVLVQYLATSWDGSMVEQSWPDPSGQNPASGTGPQSFPLSADSPFGALLGVPLGSRVLLRTPPDQQSGMPAIAWVIDLIEQKSVEAGE